MSRRPAAFRQSDLTRALRAAKNAGKAIQRIEIDGARGKIVLMIGGATPGDSEGALDTWLAAHAHPRTS